MKETLLQRKSKLTKAKSKKQKIVSPIFLPSCPRILPTPDSDQQLLHKCRPLTTFLFHTSSRQSNTRNNSITNKIAAAVIEKTNQNLPSLDLLVQEAVIYIVGVRSKRGRSSPRATDPWFHVPSRPTGACDEAP